MSISIELHYDLFLKAIQNDTEAFIELFEQEGLSPDIYLNKYKWTPLHAAAYNGNTELIQFLLRKGADKNLQNTQGLTPWQLAKRQGHQLTLDLLEGEEGQKKIFIVPINSGSPRSGIS